MKQISLTLGLVLLVLTFACNGQKRLDYSSQKPDIKVFIGKVTDKIFCRSDSNITYALFLPSNYDTVHSWPLIIAFDSHGDGRLPVNLLMAEAEKYGYIILGSNNSKNGLSLEVSSAIYDVLLQEVKWRFKIDDQRIYTMGFSGGARVAAYQGIQKGGIRTVIGCSAGLPSNTIPAAAGFNYLGVVGTLDFNYLEMKQLFKQLDQTSLPHYLLTFEGTHAWPPRETVKDIYTILQSEGMKADVITKDTEWIIDKSREIINRTNEAIIQKDYLKALEINNMGLYVFKGMPEESTFIEKDKELRNIDELKIALQQQQLWLDKENELLQNYLKFLGTKNTEWWKSETSVLRKGYTDKKGTEESKVTQRVLSYLSLACYMNAIQALKTAQWEGFRYFSDVYALVDPTNAEAAYLQAVMNMKDNKPGEAIANLKRSIQLGFKDRDRLEKDTTFQSLVENGEFVSLIKQLKQP
ncbi:MAG: hypothetical protein AB9842_11750 [Bacteroidales bacterium]